jgi:hypothetical protein
MMNVFDDEEQHFTLDMILHDNVMPSYRKEKENADNEESKRSKKNSILFNRRIKTKKNKKLIIKKKLGGSERRKEKVVTEPKVYECHHPLCEKVFLDRNSYRKHLITHLFTREKSPTNANYVPRGFL